MNAPPSEWFEDTTKSTPAPVVGPVQETPEWLRTLEVYQFLFDAHALDRRSYK